ncbi:glycoside hydrolase family 16 protein [Actinoplanes sp. CA-030573]|uniref:glycoside hydrolase family 16 protein n=1 Tax=Actinoplanes sp. CA-030573 TaxID=3239898 RepID=UPI003D8AD9A9
MSKTVIVAAVAVVAGVTAAFVGNDATEQSAAPRVIVEDFNGSELDGQDWLVYDSPDKEPPRSSAAVSVGGGMLHLTGGFDAAAGKDVGAGLMSTTQLKYGRWEVRFRVDKGAGYSAEVLLWPLENEDWPRVGEIDVAEVNDPQRQSVLHYLHHGEDDDKIGSSTPVDFTQFHTVAVDWRADRVVYYLDGVETFRVTGQTFDGGLPTESKMHLALQLDQGCNDFIPCRNAATPKKVSMDVDWVKIYPDEAH